VMLNGSRLSHEAANDSMPMRDAFAVLFFVAVGMLFDPHVLIEQPLAIAAAFLIIIIGKSIGAWMIVRVFGYPNETALTIAVALAQIGEFSFILAGVGVSIGALSEEARNLILASAMLSMVANPMLFAALDRWIAGREPQIRASAEAQMKVTADDSLPDRALIPESNHIILVGYGRVGSRVARSLHEHGMPMVLIDTDRDHCIDARKLGIPCIFGNAVSADVVNDANITQARAMLIAISQALEAGPIIRQARELNPALAILARAHSDEEVAYLHQAGADATIMGESEIARSMCDSVESLVRLSQRLETSNRPPDPAPA
jgi:CPA2 family monovalent cation:H+ antiporter-2